MRWLRRLLHWRDRNGTSDIRSRAEQARQDAVKMRPTVERAAPRMAKLPDDEFAARVSEAFRRRHA